MLEMGVFDLVNLLAWMKRSGQNHRTNTIVPMVIA